jgi:large subunit ribosomal protein L30
MAVEKKPLKKTTAKKESKTKSNSVERRLRIRLVRSVVGRPKKQREVVKGLGLRRMNSDVVRKDCPEIRGMISKIPHLVSVEVLEKK